MEEFQMNNPQTNFLDYRYKITIDPTVQKSKPQKNWEKGRISNNLKTVTGVTISEFAEAVSQPLSYSWSGGIFNGTRSNKNWKGQAVFALDFDDGTVAIEQVLDRLKEFQIFPQVWYTTFSDKPEHRKFRVIFFLDKPITEIKVHKFIMSSLLEMFPEADPSCKDASRYFLGGISSTILNTNPISTDHFIDALSIKTYTSDSNSFRKIPGKEIVLSNDYNPAGKSTFLYYNNKNVHNSAQNITTPPTSLPREIKEQTKVDFNKARQRIKIFDEFMKGRWLNHMELFGLATNLAKVKGGLKLMKNTMMKYNEEGKTDYTDNNFAILPYVKWADYYPVSIHEFSPFEEDEDLYDFISASKDTRGYIERISPIEKISLENAESLLKSKYEDVINNGEVGKIYIFSLPTALGKTEALINTTATIASPTNALKNELSTRMNIDHVITPDPAKFEDEKLNKKIQYYRSIGLYDKAMQQIKDIVKSGNNKYYSDNDIQKANRFIEELYNSMNSQSTIITTHKRALMTEFNHDTIIFDEDPINDLFSINHLKIRDVFALSMLSNDAEIKNLLTIFQNTNQMEIKSSPQLSLVLDDFIEKISMIDDESGVSSNIIEFLDSDYFLRDTHDPDLIHYIIKKPLPSNKRIVIMSATVPVEFYKKMYGDRVEVVDIKNVEQQGKVIQHTKRSCSRHGMGRYGQTISKEIGDKPVITFMKHKNTFKNPVNEMHFGNCSGYDSLKGKDIAVVGTPHRNNVEYFLLAKVLGVEFKTTDTSMTYQKIEFNGFRFNFNCFDHNDLRSIQLSLIESDLIQAVGRARTLRTDAKVDLYSNYPLSISDEFVF